MTEHPHKPDELPPKPLIQDMPPEHGVDPPPDEDEHDVEWFMDPIDARADPTVDDTESDTD